MFTLLFPGQGSQSPGMGKFLYDNFKLAKEKFEEASDAINVDFKKLCFDGSESDLALTHNTQPCLLLVSTATQEILRSQFGVTVNMAAGHSIGEYAAVVASRSIPFAEAIRAVRTRGEAMQSAVPVGQGGMVAVMGLEPDQVVTLCKYAVEKSKTGPLSPANYNSPGQIVISGSQKTIDWLKTNFKPEEVFTDAPKRAKLIPLQVSAPFHCEMMKPAEDKMRQVLTDINFKDAEFPILQNYTAQLHSKASELRENLIRQVSAPVLWMQSMELAKTKGFTKCIESGSGKVVAGLLKKIDSEAFKVFNVNTLEDIEIIENFVKTEKAN